MDKYTIPFLERYWSAIDKTPQRGLLDCWKWLKGKDKDGYGIISAPRTKQSRPPRCLWRAHRVSWELHNGPIPANLCVLHRCDNPPCCNPSHLFLGTIQENNKDRDSKCRTMGTFSKGSKHPRAKLTESKITAIRKQLKSGRKQGDIAKEFNIERSTISRINCGKRWSHV